MRHRDVVVVRLHRCGCPFSRVRPFEDLTLVRVTVGPDELKQLWDREVPRRVLEGFKSEQAEALLPKVDSEELPVPGTCENELGLLPNLSMS